MMDLNLAALPSQEFTATLDGDTYDISIYPVGQVMAADVSRNGSVLIQGIRLVANFPILPYAYFGRGNFLLLTQNDALPDWQQFGTTQSLLYLSPGEL